MFQIVFGMISDTLVICKRHVPIVTLRLQMMIKSFTKKFKFLLLHSVQIVAFREDVVLSIQETSIHEK